MEAAVEAAVAAAARQVACTTRVTCARVAASSDGRAPNAVAASAAASASPAQCAAATLTWTTA